MSMVSKDEIKHTSRRFASRSCGKHIKNKRDWVTGFNMGYEAAMRLRSVKTRRDMHDLLRIMYKRNDMPEDIV